jgi:WD40 repeat protein
MGEVYRARDARLGRDVALKVLPSDFANDPVRRQRFEQEARAIAALNHPNIVAIYDVGDGYIVTELVDGESLRGARFGTRKVVDIGGQIAAGLAAAHDAGIVHRDLKPDNILLTREGRVKILDFGLAKLQVAHTAAATETVTVRTEPGVVMGTIGYMAPEQVRGAATDHRTDIFCLGVILHELLTGARVFHGDTSVETMTAILKQDAPDLPESVPAPLRQIVSHCLEKEPANRFQSARDLSFALAQSLSHSGATSPAPAIAKSRNWRWPAIAAAALAIGITAGALLLRPPRPVEWSGVMIGGPEMALTPRLSPDGHLLAFLAMVDGLTQVAVMKPESGNWQVLTHRRDLRGVSVVAWSPDSSLIFYDRSTDVPIGVFSVPVLGGEERMVLEKATILETLPDGSLLVMRINAARELQLCRFWPDTGKSQDLPFILDGAFGNPGARSLPGGKELIAAGRPLGRSTDPIGFYIVDVATGTSRLFNAGFGNGVIGWTVDREGKSLLVASAGGSIHRVQRLPLSGGAPQTLFTAANEIWSVEAGMEGSLYVNLIDRPGTIVKLSADARSRETLAVFSDESLSLGLLPDGRVVAETGAFGRVRLMSIAKGKPAEPLINTNEPNGAPFTVLGARELAFAIGPSPSNTIAIADAEHGRISRRIAPGKGALKSLAASPDGDILYFSAGGSIWSISSAGGAAQKICAGDSAIVDPSGRSLIVARLESAKIRIFRVMRQGGQETEISADPLHPLFNSYFTPGALDANGRLLVSLNPVDSWFNPPGILDLATGKITRVPTDGVSDHHYFAWAPDGKILTQSVGMRASIWKFTPER